MFLNLQEEQLYKASKNLWWLCKSNNLSSVKDTLSNKWFFVPEFFIFLLEYW